MNINVDPKKLMDFAAYISDFSKKINTECSEISSATARLAQTMDDEDVASIQRLTQQVVQILENSDPTLKELQQKVEGYANFVMRLKSIAKG